ncbi:SIR2 family protein [Clostridium sp. AL.422]|uniref:SIR2 family NAD-dependent protein deacylase n=1 Tax=Clostridium TaxID=1485 RepID=UPI00293DAA44|nr:MULTISPECIES: SIR2 family protein [unclassified Clostridium]MDV4151431.1 SIR2 family protein [Clostridium sp. AL.422]
MYEEGIKDEIQSKGIMSEWLNKEIVCEELSREIVFEKLFDSYNYGNLGMFVGAGFSKGVFGGSGEPALNWFELINKVSKKLELDFPDKNDLIGISLPELSTILCKQLQSRYKNSYYDAKSIFKEKVCEVSNWIPNEERICVFRELFDKIQPNWIITTNYDLVLESILTGKCKSLSPLNYLSAPKGIIPIYHIHGTRLDKDSIIITQDDYIPLFRPNEYRQSKLAMTIRESTTLVLGYSLGDMNVLSSLDWSKNIYTEKNEYPYDIVQAFWTSEPKENPYRDENGNIIIEICDIRDFLEELSDYLIDKKKEYDNMSNELEILCGRLIEDDEELIEKFISKREFRAELLDLVSKFEYNMINSYIEFLIRCLSRVYKKTTMDGNFTAYDNYLKIVLDIIVKYDYNKMPPRLFQYITKELDWVLAKVGQNANTYCVGKSFKATDTWHKEKKYIPEDMVRQLYNYSQQNYLWNLKFFMNDLCK